MPPTTPLPPWAETRSHEYPRLAGEATDFGCVRRSDLGRARDFWCWNDVEWTACTRVTGHRTDTMIILFCSISRSDAGSRRWRQKGLRLASYLPWPAHEDSSTRELASPIGLLTCAQQWIGVAGINQQNQPVPRRWLPSRAESNWLPSRAASTSGLPGACRQRRCLSARSARTRPNAIFPPSSARASASSRRRASAS